MTHEDQVVQLNELWHALISNPRIHVCVDALEDATPLEVNILRMAAAKPDVILREITRQLGIASSTLSNAINRLEKRGLINRVISPRDRRSYGLALTSEGQRAFEEHLRGEKEVIRLMLDALASDAERAAFVHSFEKITNRLRIADEEA